MKSIVPKPLKLFKRDYKGGFESGRLTAQQMGMKFAENYVRSKNCSMMSGDRILSYWSGYEDAIHQMKGGII